MDDIPLVSVVIPTRNRKNKLLRLINSILQSNYPKSRLEIIVIDDASTDGTYEEIKRRFKNINVLRNEKRTFLAFSRNKGIKNSKGKYIFLIDDDNVVHKDAIKELVRIYEENKSLPIGIVAPIMYYLKEPNIIWCVSIKRNMITSLTKFIGKGEIDTGQYNRLIRSYEFPNAFMLSKEIVNKVGLFNDKELPFMYDEADFGERVRRLGYMVVCNPKAKVWHDVPLELKGYSFYRSSDHAFFLGRNRIVFHKKYSKWWQFLIFILIFNWLFTLYYLKVILLGSKKPSKERFKIAKAYLKGVLEGLKWKKFY